MGASDVRFEEVGLVATLDDAMAAGDARELDNLGFGLIAMDREGVVLFYNAAEAARSGLTPARVIGRNFFENVGQCTNNFMVAERFHDAAAERTALDETIDYVFTFVMRPTPVRLRMLAAAGSPRQYLAVEDR